jgi:hypothetical protein
MCQRLPRVTAWLYAICISVTCIPFPAKRRFEGKKERKIHRQVSEVITNSHQQENTENNQPRGWLFEANCNKCHASSAAMCLTSSVADSSEGFNHTDFILERDARALVTRRLHQDSCVRIMSPLCVSTLTALVEETHRLWMTVLTATTTLTLFWRETQGHWLHGLSPLWKFL